MLVKDHHFYSSNRSFFSFMPMKASYSFFRLFKEAVKGTEQDYTALSIDKAIFMLSIPFQP